MTLLLKRKLVIALNNYEKKDLYFLREHFEEWFLRQAENKKYPRVLVAKMVDDCIEDEWIGKKEVTDFTTTLIDQFGGGLKHPTVEYIYVRSRGREITNWVYFIPVVLEKMSAKAILFFAFTAGVTILLGYLGIRGL